MSSIGSPPPNNFAAVSRLQKPSAEGRLAPLDQSGDGKLSDAALSKMAQDISQRTGKNVSAEDLRAKLDGNGDGSISLDELKQARPPRGRGGPRSVPEDRFVRLDQNGDGKLDDSEMAKMAQNISQRTGKTVSVEDLRAKLDVNGNGSVSLDELKQAKPVRGGKKPPDDDSFDEEDGLSSDIVAAMAANMTAITGPVSGSGLTATLDNNGDGNIDQSEVNAMMAKVRLRSM